MKYFLLGAFSSAFFLYGVAMAYGAAGTTSIRPIARRAGGQTGNQALALLAFVFLAIGFGFKVSAAPFHMWTPDVYQGAPTPVTAFMSAATKVAAFVALIRVLDVAFQPLHVGLDAGDLGAGGRSRWWSAACSRSRRPTSSGCWRTPASRRPGSSSPASCRPRADRDPLGAVLPGGVRADDARGVRGRDARLGARARSRPRSTSYAGLSQAAARCWRG